MHRQYIREGNLMKAKEVSQNFSSFPWGKMFDACIEDPSSAQAAAVAREEAGTLIADPDPEPSYVVAADFVFCGQKDLAMKLLKNAVDGHFCVYEGLQNDSLWKTLRGTPEFAELVDRAKKCRDDFMAQRDKTQ